MDQIVVMADGGVWKCGDQGMATAGEPAGFVFQYQQ